VRLAWTGHRPDLFRDIDGARGAVERAARELVERESVERFLVGGQRGVDTWAAQAALDLNVPFSLFLPFSADAFTAGWTDADRAQLEELARRADEVRIVGGYSARNRLLAESGDLLVAVWTGRGGGGTAETVAFARAVGTPIHEVRAEAASTFGPVVGRGI
jgi:predicted Rossmann-fold nucleotide-binding protein